MTFEIFDNFWMPSRFSLFSSVKPLRNPTHRCYECPGSRSVRDDSPWSCPADGLARLNHKARRLCGAKQPGACQRRNSVATSGRPGAAKKARHSRGQQISPDSIYGSCRQPRPAAASLTRTQHGRSPLCLPLRIRISLGIGNPGAQIRSDSQYQVLLASKHM